jgi:hypothetical protein
VAIAQKILNIMKKVEKIDSSQMKFGNTDYQYISEAELTKKIREAMIEENVIIVPTGGDICTTEHYELETMRNNGPQKRNVFMSAVNMSYMAIDADDGSSIPLFGYGVGMDDGDKCGAKAMTAAFKVMQRQLFFIPSPSKDDPDTTASGEYNQPSASNPENPGDIVFKGGKHTGKTIREVAEVDRDYLVWMVEKSEKTPKDMREAASKVLADSSH